MVSLQNYLGREQAYVKHTFLESYLDALVHKTASVYSHIVYVDGFAGPWQSTAEKFEDTSFGIALGALRKAKASWSPNRKVQMSALLVERDTAAYARLAAVPRAYPDLSIKTYSGDFVAMLTQILRDIPEDAFAFFFIDPKGWRIRLEDLRPLLSRRNSEVIFNFMFDFINRAASIKDASIENGLDQLIPYGNFRTAIADAELTRGTELNPEERKAILVEAFNVSLARIGNYKYVAETTVLRPLKDRPLYCLFYATRHEKGIEVFRNCQIKALLAQSKARAATKVAHSESSSGQAELFRSLHDMGPDELNALLDAERAKAEYTLLQSTPRRPYSIQYRELQARVLSRHIVRFTDVNRIAARLRTDSKLFFPEWEEGRRVPQPLYRVHREQ